MTKRRKPYQLIFLLVFALLGTVGVYAYAQFHNHNHNYMAPNAARIIEGVKVGPLLIGELKTEAAADRLFSWSEKVLTRKVCFVYEEREWEKTLEELGVEIDWAAALEEAGKVGKQGNLWRRYTQWATAKAEGYQVPLLYTFNERHSGEIIAAITAELRHEPVAATRMINVDHQVLLTPEKPGWCIDHEKAVQDLRVQLGPGPIELTGGEIKVPLKRREIPPSVTQGDLEKQRINRLLGAYTTSFASSDANRSYNIKVAADALDNYLLAPGETFSFNRVVGPRSQEAGYKLAPVIVQNELVPGIGGGVCQVSTTLYNAVLRANLVVMERLNHSIPVSYVPAGWDATVAYGSIDFKFRNPYTGYILLKAQIKGKNLSIQIFGDQADFREIELTSRIIERIEPNVITHFNPDLVEGEVIVKQPGKAGLKVEVNRLFKQAGQVIHRELISTDAYKPVAEIVQIGTKKKSPALGAEEFTPEPEAEPDVEPE